nr:retrovirus-related Pol polyprotein from transposon TNT 1-94 [Tanacetum cinerariifolium]
MVNRGVTSDTSPPMLERTDFESWQQQIWLYLKGKDHEEYILQSINEGPFKIGQCKHEITLGTDGPYLGPERDRVVVDHSQDEKDRLQADIRFELTNDDRESQMYDEFEHFGQHKGENIHDYYVNFTMLINDMRHIKMNMPKIQMNSKVQGNNNRGAVALRNGGARYRTSNATVGKGKPIKCYNCNGIVYDEAGPSYDSDTLSEVQDHDNCLDIMNETHEEHDIHNDVQQDDVVASDTEYTIHDSKDTLELAETTRKQMIEKMKDPECVKKKAKALTEKAKSAKPITAMTVYPPNKLAKLVPKVLPTKSQGIQKAFINEIKEIKEVFDQMEAEVDQNVVDKKCDEIERKNLLTENENLIVELLFKDVFYIAADFVLIVSRFFDMHDAYTVVQKRIAKLEAENSILTHKIRNNDHDEMIKHFSKLEVEHLNFQLKYQHLKERFGNKKTVTSSDAPAFELVFVIGNLKEQLQGRGNTIRELKEEISRFQNKYSVTGPILDFKALDSKNKDLNAKVNALQDLNERFRAENKKVKQRVKDATASGGSKPRSNTKKVRTLPAKSDKKKVEDHSRNNKSSVKQKNHVIQIVLWYLDSGCSNNMTGDRSRLMNFVKKFIKIVSFRNDHFGVIMGYGDYVIGDSVISRVYYVEGIKSQKYSHKPKSENTNLEVLNTLHMDLYGPMRVQTFNEKKYILVIVDDYSSADIFHQKSVPRTPQQNGVIERQNRNLVEAARTMLIFSKALMFLWAEVVATACYTQNRSLIHTRHNKTSYELVHDKKPNLKFLCVFGALCYPTYDSEDLGKLRPTDDIRIFIGYAPNRKGYRIYNKRTR